MKAKIEIILLVLGCCLFFSFCASGIRVMGHDECTFLNGEKKCPNTPCLPFYVDRLEPLLSTRWFCEIK